jgi:hypothetical protein
VEPVSGAGMATTAGVDLAAAGPAAADLAPVDLAGLTRRLREAAWMDEAGRGCDTFVALDRARLDDVDLLILAPSTSRAVADVRYFVPVHSGSGAEPVEAHRSLAFDRAITAAVAASLTLPTVRGAGIAFRGVSARFGGQLPFDPGWSSNALSLIDLDGTPHIHKMYRRLRDGTHEPTVLRRMTGSGYTADHAGGYEYVEASGRRWPLGVLYRYVPGDPLDAPLRDNIRALWPHLAAGGTVEAHLAPLADLLRDVGRFLARFHAALRERIHAGSPFPAGGYAVAVARRLDRVAPSIRDDPALPAGVRAAALDGLASALRIAHAAVGPGMDVDAGTAAGPAHGDLHLTHLILKPADGTPGAGHRAIRVIDVSTPALDPAEPGFATQSPWQDLVSLSRALEYFTGAEFVYEASLRFGESEDDTCDAALLAVAGTGWSGSGWDDGRREVLLWLHAVAEQWRQRVLGLILSGYAGEETDPTGHPVWRLLYLRRLLHELEYNYDHGRRYFAAMDLRHAIALADTRPAAG